LYVGGGVDRHNPATHGVDAIVVDPVTRKPIARPRLTLAIDVATRVVMSMAMTLDAPSIYPVSLGLTRAQT
jgi:putative transposase